jgi:ABC-type nitrate/sulfonate/bicarbonate transport system substrate-binding protein
VRSNPSSKKPIAPAVTPTASRSREPLRIGFVDLVDAAPLIVAHECGFFADEGLRVVLRRQLGWGSVRDRLTFGDLDAAHALLGMPLFSRLRRGGFLEPLVSVMNLGAGGDAITLSKRLFDAGVRNAAAVGQFGRSMASGERLVFAHVFNCSTHHFLLREWLAAGGVDPDRDVELRVFPPNQMPGHMARGHVDGFCAGEPWNTIAERDGVGRIAVLTTDIIPNHPEKVLATTARWAEANPAALVPLVRAVIRGCAYCDDAANRDAVAEMLSRPEYLALPAVDLRKSLALREDGTATPARSFAPADTFPSKTHAAWMVSEMVRWGQLPADVDVRAIARSCVDTAAYRAAAETFKLACPPTDFPPMRLRNGSFEPTADAVHIGTTEGAMT